MKSSLWIALTSTVTIATLGSGVGSVHALTLSGTSGLWGSPTGGQNVSFVTSGNENQVRWGNAFNVRQGNSGLGFTGVGLTDVNVGDVFQLGRLRHFNNTIFAGSQADSAPLSVTLNFSNPMGVAATFDFNFFIEETLNIPPCPYPGAIPCPDRITFASAPTPQTFLMEGIHYTLELLGFSNTSGGAPLAEFISEEGGTSTAYLFGRLTAEQPESSEPSPPQAVPEPMTGLGLALVGLYWAKGRLGAAMAKP